MREYDEDVVRAEMKAQIRARRRATRRALPAAGRERRSRAIVEGILSLPEWRAASTVLAFVPMRREVQIAGAVEVAWAAGKTVATTRMNASFDDLELRLWSAGDPLEESGMMFMQPLESAPPVEERSVDLVLVPAFAVDARGHRVGHGKGFYDRLLPRLEGALRVAVIFDFERVVEVPTRPGDEPVDVIVTDERVLRVEAR